MQNERAKVGKTFSKYQAFIIAILAILQFTVILDFMVLSPLGAILLDQMHITTSQFGLVVSAYAFSAGASGILAAGFADKFDRKKLLLFFYTGFMLGTFLCGIAPDYRSLLIGRIVTGIFGGVMSSVSYAIITDIFVLEVRGRVMGFVQMAFATSQVLGIPVGLYLANLWNWHAPFILILAVGILVGVVIVIFMQPIDGHLKLQKKQNPFYHLFSTISQSRYLQAFAATTLLSTGGFMLMPFASAFTVNNLGVSLETLPWIYMVTGVCSMIAGPIIGKYSDKIGKYKIFVFGSFISLVMVFIYTNLGVTPLVLVIILNVLLFIGISSRIISSSALITAVPEAADRGAFMGINSSVQQISGGIASAISGLIVFQAANGKIQHYNTVGYVVAGTILFTVVMMYFISQFVAQKRKTQPGFIRQ